MEYYDVCGINKFVERDVDMLLAEELRVNAAFGKWLMDKFGASADLIFPAAHINVSVAVSRKQPRHWRLKGTYARNTVLHY